MKIPKKTFFSYFEKNASMKKLYFTPIFVRDLPKGNGLPCNHKNLLQKCCKTLFSVNKTVFGSK